MNKETKHYATFWCPGSFVAESYSRDMPTPDPRKVEWPDNAYAFRLFKRDDVVDGAARYEGRPEQIGPTYYHPDSYIQSLQEARTNPKATPILISNMEGNGWKQIIWTRWNTWPQPFDPGAMEILKP